MNETLFDFIKINFIHKELVELLLNCSEEDRPKADYAFDVFLKILDKWRGNEPLRITQEDDSGTDGR